MLVKILPQVYFLTRSVLPHFWPSFIIISINIPFSFSQEKSCVMSASEQAVIIVYQNAFIDFPVIALLE